MNYEVIRPTREVKEFRGRLSYGESVRAWNTVRFKKELINEFSKLKERQSKFEYKCVLHNNFDELMKALKNMKKNGVPVPIILSFIKVSSP